MKTKKIIKWLCLLTWTLIIFLLSHQPNSGQATHSVIEKIIPFIKEQSIIDILNFIIRKLAHVTEYLILSIITYSLLNEYQLKEKKKIYITIIFCFIFAITDELHQTLVMGRTGRFLDCIIDTTGASIPIIAKKIKTLKNNFS